MAFDRDQIARLSDCHGAIVRVVVADIAGSTPREVGAAMCVWEGGQEGTIGGGMLEHQATIAARKMLAQGHPAQVERVPLGPTLGQCCGGSVILLHERWDRQRLKTVDDLIVARALPGKAAEMPLAVRHLVARSRGQGMRPAPCLVRGWFVEPVAQPAREIWVWGAGHVGRAIVEILAGLPDLRIVWVDTAAMRFPAVPEGVVQRVSASPADLVSEAPHDADHLVLTFSHALDLELCHRLLGRGFGSVGLIGSATKWARFRSRLGALGHTADAIGRIACPIGRTEFGKHPQAIAIGVAAEILQKAVRAETTEPETAPVARGDRR